jgi:hypothetical protein
MCEPVGLMSESFSGGPPGLALAFRWGAASATIAVSEGIADAAFEP